MASLFRPRRSEDERGAGGKLVRGRRDLTSSASPYARPPNLPPPAPVQSQSPKWLLGLISGAGKLISSVFGSDSEESSQSSSSYSGESSGNSSDEDGDANVTFKECNVLNQGRNKTELVKNGLEGSLAFVPKSDAKIAIEQLLMQETFSRDECNKLTKILQSRVVDFQPSGIDDAGRQRNLPDNSIGRSTAFTGAWRSMAQVRKLSKATLYFTSNFDALSPGSPLQAWTPDLRDKAVMEAKKYVEEKKLGSSSKSDLDCGPCTLNTDLLHYGIKGEVGSPVDMAKSYMQYLPPWRSPSLSSTGLKTPPPEAMQLYKDGTTNYCLPSSKVPRKNSVAIGSHDDLDETGRSSLKSTDNMLEFSKFRKENSSTNLLGHRNSKFPFTSDEKESHVEVVLNGQKAVEVNRPLEACNITSSDIVTESEAAVQVVNHIQESLVGTTNSSEPTPEKGSESKVSDADVLILLKNQKDVKDPPQIEEHGGSVPNSHGSLAQDSTSLKQDGYHLPETNVIVREEMTFLEPQPQPQRKTPRRGRKQVVKHGRGRGK